MKSSMINLIPKDQLMEIVKNSCTMKEVMVSIGVKPQSGYYNSLRSRLDLDNINTDHFISHKSIPVNKRTDEDVLRLNCKTSRSVLLPRMLKHMKYKCVICNIDSWHATPLTLQIDHIDGNNANNEITNLRFLCPNCHSLTDNYAGGGRIYNTGKQAANLELAKLRVEAKQKMISEKKAMVLTSSIDFTKHGWIIELSKIFKTTPQAARRWVVKNMYEWYMKTCSKHK